MSEDYLDDLVNEDGCPQCQGLNVTAVGYTWWGGVIGPRLLKHNRCKDCKFTYNRKTRKSNNTAIIIYAVVVFVVAMAVFYFLRT